MLKNKYTFTFTTTSAGRVRDAIHKQNLGSEVFALYFLVLGKFSTKLFVFDELGHGTKKISLNSQEAIAFHLMFLKIKRDVFVDEIWTAIDKSLNTIK